MKLSEDGRYVHGQAHYKGDVRRGFADPAKKFGHDYMFTSYFYAVGAVYDEDTNMTTVYFSATPPVKSV